LKLSQNVTSVTWWLCEKRLTSHYRQELKRTNPWKKWLWDPKKTSL